MIYAQNIETMSDKILISEAIHPRLVTLYQKGITSVRVYSGTGKLSIKGLSNVVITVALSNVIYRIPEQNIMAEFSAGEVIIVPPSGEIDFALRSGTVATILISSDALLIPFKEYETLSIWQKSYFAKALVKKCEIIKDSSLSVSLTDKLNINVVNTANPYFTDGLIISGSDTLAGTAKTTTSLCQKGTIIWNATPHRIGISRITPTTKNKMISFVEIF